MNSAVFVVTTGSYSGKSLVTLGIMQMVVKKTSSVAFFRPIIHGDHRGARDNHIDTMLSHFNLKMDYKEAFALTRSEAIALHNAGKTNELFARIIDKYKSLESRFDFIVVEGTDFFNEGNLFDFNMSNLIAKDLHLPVILVINGENGNSQTLADHILVEYNAVRDKGNEVIMIVVNKAKVSQEELEAFFHPKDLGEIILTVIPSEPFLGKPMLKEIKNALNAELILGGERGLNEVAMKSIAGAMQLCNYLQYLDKDCLVVTPGDRADLICATLLANLSSTYPRTVGIVLTGGITPERSVLKLIEGVQRSIPILAVESGTFETIHKIADVKSKIYPENTLKIKRSIELFEHYTDMPLLERKIAAFRSEAITPKMFQYRIVQKSHTAQKHIVLPEGFEERILCAASLFVADRLGRLTLLGDPKKILADVTKLGLYWDEKRIQIVDPETALEYEDFSQTLYELRKEKGMQIAQARDLMLDPSYFGTMMVYKGLADGMVSGAAHTTAHTIRPALQFIKTRPGVKVVSSVFFMLLSDRVLVYGDCAIVPNPTSEQLADIAIASARTAQSFDIDPKVALLSYSSGDSGSGEEVEKVKKAVDILKSAAPDLLVEGPIQYDAAVDPEVGRRKLPDSPVAGQANVLIFPDLNTGNNTYKAVQRETNALAIGPILQGLNKPVNDLSRGATVEDIYNTIIVTTIQAANS